MTSKTLFAVADWHADQAIRHYHIGELEDYARHIAICDALRRKAYSLKRGES